jgi:hypothetical protein
MQSGAQGRKQRSVQQSCGNSCPHFEHLLDMHMHMMPHSSWAEVSGHKRQNLQHTTSAMNKNSPSPANFGILQAHPLTKNAVWSANLTAAHTHLGKGLKMVHLQGR